MSLPSFYSVQGGGLPCSLRGENPSAVPYYLVIHLLSLLEMWRTLQSNLLACPPGMSSRHVLLALLLAEVLAENIQWW